MVGPDAISLSTGAPSQYFFAAIEDSDLLVIDAAAHQQIVDRVPGYSEAMRAGLQKHAAAKDVRIVKSLSAMAEERTGLHTDVPDIAQRVPQWMLASYLGISPETVSRIRKNSRGNRRRAVFRATIISRGDEYALYGASE